jgi:hypothetical protein
MSNNTVRAPEIAQNLIENGFRVVPLPHGQKGPKILNWQERVFAADDFHGNGGVGIKIGTGIVAIDIDCYGPDIVADICTEFERRFGSTLRRTGFAPKTALLARCDIAKKIKVALAPSGCAPVDKNGLTKGEQIEVLTNGQQLVAFGIHPETGKPYHWHGNEPWAEGNTIAAALPALSSDALQDFLGWIEGKYGSRKPTIAGQTAVMGDVLSRLTGYMKPEVVAEGGRNDAVLKYVGHLRGKGTPESVVLTAALDFNTANCSPPLDNAEVERIVATYASQGHPDATDWPEPTPLVPVLHPAPQFEYEMLPDVFLGFVRDASERMGVPPDYLAVPLMLSAAAALGSGWALCPKENDKSWQETAVLWGGIVAPPGSKKSPCLQIAAKPLHRIEAKLRTAYDSALGRYHLAKQAAPKNSNAAVLGLKEPKQERAVVQDATYQALAEICSTSPKGVVAQWDEVAGMISAWRIKGQEAARGFFLTAWSGDLPYTLDRKEGGTTHIARLFIVISGGVQPSVLGALVRDARQNGASNDGLIQRFQLMVYPDDSTAPEEVDRAADEHAAARALDAIERLRSITPAEIGVGMDLKSGRGVLNFSDAAQTVFSTLRRKIHSKLRDPACDPLLASHYAKMPGAIAKLTMLLHLLDGGRGDITLDAMQKAVRWSVYMKGHAERIYSLSQLADEADANTILKKIKAGALLDGFTAYDIKRKGWAGLKSETEVEAALGTLVATGWVRPQTVQAGGGRPTVKYLIHPKGRE